MYQARRSNSVSRAISYLIADLTLASHLYLRTGSQLRRSVVEW